MNDGKAKIVRFRSRSRSQREWVVTFDLGSRKANVLAMLDYAWKHNASVVRKDK